MIAIKRPPDQLVSRKWENNWTTFLVEHRKGQKERRPVDHRFAGQRQMSQRG